MVHLRPSQLHFPHLVFRLSVAWCTQANKDRAPRPGNLKPTSFSAGSSQHQGLGLRALAGEANYTTHSSDHTVHTTLRSQGAGSQLKCTVRRWHPSITKHQDKAYLHLLASKLGGQKPTASGEVACPGPPLLPSAPSSSGSDPAGHEREETRAEFSRIDFVGSESHLLPGPHIPGHGGRRHPAGLGPLTSGGCGWGCCPAPEGGG